MLLPDKVVIISGIGPGMGLKLAIHAAKEGARGIVVTARRKSNLDMTVEVVKELGTHCDIIGIENDVRDAAGCQRVADATVERFGAIHALINNQSLHGPLDRASEGDLDLWVETFKGNVIGTMKMCRAVLDQMKKQGGGYIVNVNTMGSRRTPIISEASYCAGKAALTSASRTLAEEVGRFGIHVNGLYPGWMWGATVKNYFERWSTESGQSQQELYDQVADQMALKRIVTDDEVALAGLFLASDYASAITGAILDANGGNYMP
jgi:NAD(P)-dependent dehydrogenase (short-subunit alcohol dehydrogenase family)